MIWNYTFGYDTGYRVVGITVVRQGPPVQYTYGYTPFYDLRGNITSVTVLTVPPFPTPPDRPIDLPDTMEYDAHNRMVEYTYGAGAGLNKKVLKYDPMSRVFRKEEWVGVAPPEMEKATHYYYKGSALVQEYDELPEGDPPAPGDDLLWDYLRGADGQVLRRRQRDAQWADTDTLYYNDILGTIKEEGDPTQGGGRSAPSNGYVLSAEGEPLPITGGQPTQENHIRFHGGFLEDKEFHTTQGSDLGHLYRMGVRHYSPPLGRFLQREPMLNSGPSGFQFPLSANPYLYGYNNSLMYTDISGLQACCGGGVGGGIIGPYPHQGPQDPHKPGFMVGGGVYDPVPQVALRA